jgi:3-oxoadipate enol-lactonase
MIVDTEGSAPRPSGGERRTDITTHRVQVGPVKLVVDEAGARPSGGEQEGRRLILVHGFTGGRDDFEPLMPALAAAGWHVLAPDNRGHGESTKLPEEDDYEVERFAEDVLGLADAWGWSEFALLGHSLGGMIVQHVIARAPERVRALVLMDCTYRTLDLDPDMARTGAAIVRDKGLDALIDLLADAEDPLGTPAHERVAATVPGYRERGERNARRSAGAMYAHMLEDFVTPRNRSAEIARITCPTLVIVGSQDERFVPPAREMAELIPDVRLVVVPDAGHSPQFENPAAFERAVLDFLATV